MIQVIQKEGELILTFPGGYHSGFNYGFNVFEAIGYSTPRWVKYARTALNCNCLDLNQYVTPGINELKSLVSKVERRNYPYYKLVEEHDIALGAAQARWARESRQKLGRGDVEVVAPTMKLQMQPRITRQRSSGIDQEGYQVRDEMWKNKLDPRLKKPHKQYDTEETYQIHRANREHYTSLYKKGKSMKACKKYSLTFNEVNWDSQDYTIALKWMIANPECAYAKEHLMKEMKKSTAIFRGTSNKTLCGRFKNIIFPALKHGDGKKWGLTNEEYGHIREIITARSRRN